MLPLPRYRWVVVRLREAACLLVCLVLLTGALPGVVGATSERLRISLSGITLDGPDASGNMEIVGTVEVRGVCPHDVEWCGFRAEVQFLGRDDEWPLLPDYYDCQRECMVKDVLCLAPEQHAQVFTGHVSEDILLSGEQFTRLQPQGEGRAVPFLHKTSIQGTGYRRMRVVALLILTYSEGCRDPEGSPLSREFWWPNKQRSLWDVSRQFDLPWSKPRLTVKLDYTPKAPTLHDTIEFVATVLNSSGGPLTYEWHVKEEHGIERPVFAETSGMYRVKLFPGSYTVTVRVSDGPGGPAKNSVSLTVGKGNRPPTVRLVCRPEYPIAGDIVTVVALGHDPDGDALEYRFIDLYSGKELGTRSTDRDVNLSGPAQAMSAYKVRVIAYDGRGGTASASLMVSVGEETRVYCWPEKGRVTVNDQPVTVGTERKVSEGDVIETSASGVGLSPGRASLRYSGGSQVRVRPGTRMQLGSKAGFISLEKGGLWNEVPGSAKEAAPTFTTPSAIGTVKGTEFEVVVEDDGATIFRVFDGLVDVWDLDMTKTVSVHAGETTTCERGGVPADAQPFDQASVDRWWEEAALPSAAQPGDANGDGLCNEVDALMALRMAVGLQFPDAARMDVNGDGAVTEVDALQILKWAVTGGQCGRA